MEESQHSLNPGDRLNHYKIIRILGEGGFGITYLAEDTELGMNVVIKEYFPNEFAMRSGGSKTITAKRTSMKDFSRGMKRFKEEAQTLAKFNHPSIVKILGYFEANDTAYFVMEYEEGIDLSRYIKEKGTPLKQEEILGIMMPILEGLKEVHSHHYLHRDIKPGNILLRTNKAPVLIDFGASKLAIGDVSKSITSMLTEGYAPLEQYSTDVKQQGPFTDLYAVAAVMFRMITGQVPPSAQTRSYQLLQDGEDPYKKLQSMNLSGYDQNFLHAIDRALSLKAKDRSQNVQEFQRDIAGQIKKERSSVVPGNGETRKGKGALVAGLILLLALGGGTAFMLISDSKGLDNEVNIGKVKTESTPVASAEKKDLYCDGKVVKECYRLGLDYLEGKGVAKNIDKAKDFFVKACTNGDARGCTGVGLLYARDQGVSQDSGKAISYLKDACKKNNAEGCYNLAYMYDKGQGVPKNATQIMEYYSKACEGGLAKSCYRLGNKYLNGKDSAKDYTKSKKFLTKACSGGEARACTSLGVMYARGLGVSKDYKQAGLYFEKACQNGNSEGCFNLGRMHEKGIGYTKNLSEGKVYYKKACDDGYQKACKALAGS